MILVAGVGVGLATAAPVLREGSPGEGQYWLLASFAMLSGASAAGVPLLAIERRRSGPRRRPFGPGQTLWFTHGAAAWLLWPPIVVGRMARPGAPATMGLTHGATAEICLLYGTPPMAVYMTLALLVGGRFRRRRRPGRRPPAPLPWTERFGLLLGMAWAAAGLYVLSLIYRDKIG